VATPLEPSSLLFSSFSHISPWALHNISATRLGSCVRRFDLQTAPIDSRYWHRLQSVARTASRRWLQKISFNPGLPYRSASSLDPFPTQGRTNPEYLSSTLYQPSENNFLFPKSQRRPDLQKDPQVACRPWSVYHYSFLGGVICKFIAKTPSGNRHPVNVIEDSRVYWTSKNTT